MSGEGRADYAPSAARGRGVITRVEPGSPAAASGVSPGQAVVAVDGQPVRDVLDWQWLTDGESVRVTLQDQAGDTTDVELSRDALRGWGIEFGDLVFDRIKTCRNDCAFCFMTQLPAGLRSPLYLRDDDFRLSFLQGNFITLTNLKDEDVERIATQRLSPLYVSLHAVDPEIRARLMCVRGQDEGIARFDELLDEGIDLHVQIVLVPGVNDGEHLDRTLNWLAEREGILSVGIVPVGFTRHQSSITASYTEPIDAALVIEQVQRWQFAMRERDGVTWVHLADEFYLNARAPFPRTEWYDGYPQYENGIGLVRAFVDETMELRTELESALLGLPADQELVTVVTGMMAATTIAGALDACEARGRVRLLVVPNRFFGGNVSVTGLLTGQDIADAMASDAHAGTYLVPEVVFNADGVTLDDMALGDIESRGGAKVLVTSSDAAGLLDGLLRAGNGML